MEPDTEEQTSWLWDNIFVILFNLIFGAVTVILIWICTANKDDKKDAPPKKKPVTTSEKPVSSEPVVTEPVIKSVSEPVVLNEPVLEPVALKEPVIEAVVPKEPVIEAITQKEPTIFVEEILEQVEDVPQVESSNDDEILAKLDQHIDTTTTEQGEHFCCSRVLHFTAEKILTFIRIF